MKQPLDTMQHSFGHRQWKLVSVLFCAALINYIDRQSLSVVASRMQSVAQTGWTVCCGVGIGTLAGGLASGMLIRRGLSAGLAYHWTMLGGALLIPLSPLVALLSSVQLFIFLAAVLALAHMGRLVTLTATIVELYPQAQVGTASRLIAMGGGLGGMFSSEIVGYLVTHGG